MLAYLVSAGPNPGQARLASPFPDERQTNLVLPIWSHQNMRFYFWVKDFHAGVPSHSKHQAIEMPLDR